MSIFGLILCVGSTTAGLIVALSGPVRRLRGVSAARAAETRQGSSAEGRSDIGDRRARTAPAASSGPDNVPLLLELIGSMLEAGLALPRALEIASRVAGGSAHALSRAAAALHLGTDWSNAWPDTRADSDVGELRAALHFAAATGAPSAELLYARARQLRRSRHRDLERRAAALGVRLVIPLGVCSLPAFLCLGVVPVLLAMLPGP